MLASYAQPGYRPPRGRSEPAARRDGRAARRLFLMRARRAGSAIPTRRPSRVRCSLLIRPNDDLASLLSVDRFEDDFSTAPTTARRWCRAAVARDPSDVVSGSAGLVLDKSMRDLNFNVDRRRHGLGARPGCVREPNIGSTMPGASSATPAGMTADRHWRDADEYTFNAGHRLDRPRRLADHARSSVLESARARRL